MTYWDKRSYAEASTAPDGLAERGYLYGVGELFTIAAGATTSFEMTPGTVSTRILYYSIDSTLHPVEVILFEGGTATAGTYTPVPRNLNRNYADASSTVLRSCTNPSGGTAIFSEVAGTASKGGGSAASGKVITLRAMQRYVMSFTNTGAQSTRVHFDIGWSEGDPSPKPLWVT